MLSGAVDRFACLGRATRGRRIEPCLVSGMPPLYTIAPLPSEGRGGMRSRCKGVCQQRVRASCELLQEASSGALTGLPRDASPLNSPPAQGGRGGMRLSALKGCERRVRGQAVNEFSRGLDGVSERGAYCTATGCNRCTVGVRPRGRVRASALGARDFLE